MSVLDCHLLDPPVLCISLPCQLRVPEHFRAAYCIVVCEGRDMDMQFKLLVSQATSKVSKFHYQKTGNGLLYF